MALKLEEFAQYADHYAEDSPFSGLDSRCCLFYVLLPLYW